MELISILLLAVLSTGDVDKCAEAHIPDPICATASHKSEPALIVGITIDQMRADFLYRFEDHFSDRGFKRLIKNGTNRRRRNRVLGTLFFYLTLCIL